jgi:hypothetical protein
VAALPRLEPETSCKYEPETVGLQVTSLEASLALKTGDRGFERAVLSFSNALETQNRCLEALPPVK